MKSQIELILEHQNTQDNFLKELLGTVGVHIEGTLTWGAGITAFYGPVKELLLNQDPKFTEVEIAMVSIAAIALVIKDNSPEISKLVNMIKDKKLEPVLNKSVNFLKTIEDIGIKVAETSGFVANNLLDIASFTFMFLPIIDAIKAYINSEQLTMDVAPQYFKALLFSVGILSIKNLFNRLVRRLRDLRTRNRTKDTKPPENITEGVFTSDFIDYMNTDVFDEELEEVQLTSHASHKHSAGDHILEQEETEEENIDVAFNIIESKYHDELRIWLDEYLSAQRRYEENLQDEVYSKKEEEEMDNIEQNIEFAFSKIKWIIEEIIQIFKLYGLAHGNQYTVWNFEGEYTIEGRYFEPLESTIIVPLNLVPWLIEILDNEIDPAWDRWTYIGNLGVDRYGYDEEGVRD